MIGTLVVLGLVVVGLVLLYARSVRRRRSFFARRTAEAARVGLQPAPLDPWLGDVANRVFGTRGQAERVIAGPRLRACDFTYQASSTSTAARCHVIAYDLPVALPPIAVLKHNPFAPGQEFESSAFNAAFSVECADPRYASAILHPLMLDWLLRHPEVEWRIDGRALVTWGAVYWTVPLVVRARSLFDGIVERIPPYVLEDYGIR